MKTALITHPDAEAHIGYPGHPESVERIQTVLNALNRPQFSTLVREDAPLADPSDISRVHPLAFISSILDQAPNQGEFIALDSDTALSPGTAAAVSRGVGAACRAVDGVINGDYDTAFCAIRPPGHHAEPNRAMGFCFFNAIAIAALRAQQVQGLGKVAVIDFDVHHGNGTQAALADIEGIYFGSIHQHPHYPNTGNEVTRQGQGFVRNIPLPAGTPINVWRDRFENIILADVDAFEPELILVSAGFDAHRDDPLGEFNLTETDYRRIGVQLADLAKKHANSRLVAVLEGGYNLKALADSASAFVEALQDA